ncbi:MAG: CPBP family intramembrane metalloprotease [Euryarchaeota archaeon]|nr:CPBP family intramembrane metalloprotease [Euryarchaeota archaeon]
MTGDAEKTSGDWRPIGSPREDRPGDASGQEVEEDWNWFGASSTARRGRLPFGAGDTGRTITQVFAVVVVALVVLVVGGDLLAVMLSQLLDGGGPESADPVRRGDIFYGLSVMLVLFTIPPLLWVYAFYEGKLEAWRTRLFLHAQRFFGFFGWGVIGGFGLLVAGAIIAIVLDSVIPQPENRVVQDIGAVLTWELVFFISIAAAVGEEIFFRGFLQPRIGIVPANVLFGLVHLSYGVPLQVIVPLVLGFAFSWMTLKTRSLVPAIVAHFTFDLIQLSLAKLFFG